MEAVMVAMEVKVEVAAVMERVGVVAAAVALVEVGAGVAVVSTQDAARSTAHRIARCVQQTRSTERSTASQTWMSTRMSAAALEPAAAA